MKTVRYFQSLLTFHISLPPHGHAWYYRAIIGMTTKTAHICMHKCTWTQMHTHTNAVAHKNLHSGTEAWWCRPCNKWSGLHMGKSTFYGSKSVKTHVADCSAGGIAQSSIKQSGTPLSLWQCTGIDLSALVGLFHHINTRTSHCQGRQVEWRSKEMFSYINTSSIYIEK